MIRPTSIVTMLVAFALHAESVSAELPPAAKDLVYFDPDILSQVKTAIEAKDPFFLDRYHQILVEGDGLLTKAPDPVVNKAVIPPSGDKHD